MHQPNYVVNNVPNNLHTFSLDDILYLQPKTYNSSVDIFLQLYNIYTENNLFTSYSRNEALP